MNEKKFKIQGVELADAGFYINLKKSTDRKKNVEKQKKKFNIENLKRMDAVTDPWHQTSCTKSHLKIFEDSLKKEYDSIVVFEDDFQLYDNVYLYDKNLTKNFTEYLEEFGEHIKKTDWDIILLGFNGRKYTIPQTKHLSKNFSSTGAWGYIIKKNAMEFILKNFNYASDYLAIDNIIPEMTYRGFKSYTSVVQIVHHGVGFISTLNPQGPVNYDTWIEGNYYASTWLDKPNCENFDKCLEEIYKRGKKQKNEIYKIINYDGNYEKLNDYLNQNHEISKSFIIVDALKSMDDKIRDINYSFSVESRRLLHLSNFIDFKKLNLKQKTVTLDFKKIKNKKIKK